MKNWKLFFAAWLFGAFTAVVLIVVIVGDGPTGFLYYASPVIFAASYAIGFGFIYLLNAAIRHLRNHNGEAA